MKTHATAELGRRVRQARETANASQDDARAAIGVSRRTYSRIESGNRELAGAELVMLADRFGVRASSITGISSVTSRARFATSTAGSPSMERLREHLYAYLELDTYLTDQGISGA